MHDYDLDNKRQYEIDFHSGVVSKQAREYWKDYWYNEFKREQMVERDRINEIPLDLRNQPLKPSECFHGKSKYELFLDEQNELWQKQVVEPGYEEQRIKCDGILEQMKNVPVIDMSNLPCDLSYLIDGTYEKYEKYLMDNPDRPISFDNWKYMVEHYPNQSYHATKEQFEPGKPFTWIDKDGFDVLTGKKEPTKSIGIIGNVDHGKPMVIVLNEPWDAARQALDTVVKSRSIDITELPIKSIVPIHDIYPEDKIQWNEQYDKPWDIKKEKKVSHKRTNKRK